MDKTIICPECKGNEIIKWCKRKTENRGLIQRYKCNLCDYYFTLDDSFYRMRNAPQKIIQLIDLSYRGVSTRKVQEHLGVFYPHNATHMSIYNWVTKYSKMISNYTNRLKLNVGEEVQIDEIEFHRRHDHKKGMKGADKNFFIDSIDPDTKFMVSFEYSKTRGSSNIKAITKRIKERTENQIKIATTDDWNAYVKVIENPADCVTFCGGFSNRHSRKQPSLINGNVYIKNVFGYNNKLGKYNVIHNKNMISEDEGNFNHPIERLHNSIRARTKTFRGFHGSINSANAIMKGFEIYYNFITKHQAIKKCPFELAIPELVLSLENEKNKWFGLIYLTEEASL